MGKGSFFSGFKELIGWVVPKSKRCVIEDEVESLVNPTIWHLNTIKRHHSCLGSSRRYKELSKLSKIDQEYITYLIESRIIINN